MLYAEIEIAGKLILSSSQTTLTPAGPPVLLLTPQRQASGKIRK